MGFFCTLEELILLLTRLFNLVYLATLSLTVLYVAPPLSMEQRDSHPNGPPSETVVEDIIKIKQLNTSVFELPLTETFKRLSKENPIK